MSEILDKLYERMLEIEDAISDIQYEILNGNNNVESILKNEERIENLRMELRDIDQRIIDEEYNNFE